MGVSPEHTTSTKVEPQQHATGQSTMRHGSVVIVAAALAIRSSRGGVMYQSGPPVAQEPLLVEDGVGHEEALLRGRVGRELLHLRVRGCTSMTYRHTHAVHACHAKTRCHITRD